MNERSESVRALVTVTTLVAVGVGLLVYCSLGRVATESPLDPIQRVGSTADCYVLEVNCIAPPTEAVTFLDGVLFTRLPLPPRAGMYSTDFDRTQGEADESR
jgi:hypothetical protein